MSKKGTRKKAKGLIKKKIHGSRRKLGRRRKSAK